MTKKLYETKLGFVLARAQNTTGWAPQASAEDITWWTQVFEKIKQKYWQTQTFCFNFSIGIFERIWNTVVWEKFDELGNLSTC